MDQIDTTKRIIFIIIVYKLYYDVYKQGFGAEREIVPLLLFVCYDILNKKQNKLK